MAITKEKFSSITGKTTSITVTIDGQPEEVLIRQLTASEAKQITQYVKKNGEDMAFLASCYIANEDGTRMYVGKDVQELESVPLYVINKIVEAGNAHNGLAGDEDEAGNS